MRSIHTSRLIAAATFLQMGVGVSGAWAQAEPAANELTLEEIVVTATKRSERLQDVPVAVSAITADDIAARGFTQYGDTLNSLPGVHFEDAGPGRSQIRIRGLSTVEGGVPSTVATYFGETVTSVLTLGGGKPNFRLVDIDRVEVLRGPQGTLFGANALAGVVRIIPQAPRLDGFAATIGTRAASTAHSDDASFHVEGVLNLPLIDDRLAIRLVGYRDDIAGYIDNSFAGRPALDWTDSGEAFLADAFGIELDLPPGALVSPAVPAISRKDINSEDTWGARAAVAWQASDQLRFDLTYATQDSTLNSEPYVLPGPDSYAQSRAMDFFRQGVYEEDMDMASLTASYEFANMELVSASSWFEFDRLDVSDLGSFAADVYGLPPLPWSQYSPGESRQFTQEVRLQSTGDGPLQWTVGAFYLDQDVKAAQISIDYSCPTCLSQAVTGDDFTFSAVADEFFSEEQRALFGEMTYDLSPKWTVGAGVRYFEGDLRAGAVVLEGFEVGGEDFAIPPNSKSEDELNPSAHVRFRPTEDLTLYLQAARGFRSGQANAPLPDGCQEEAAEAGISALTDPDTLWNYELGSKAVLADGRVNLNAAIYRANWEGVQVAAGLSCGFGAVVNGGDAIGEGVEVEVVAQLVRDWRINLAAAYNHNEFDGASPATGFADGERLPGSSEKNGSAGLQYDFALGASWSGFARADYVYTGDVLRKFGRGAGAIFVTEDARSVGNLRLGLRRGNLAIELFGRNVTDERGISASENPERGGRQILIRPREIGVALRYSLE